MTRRERLMGQLASIGRVARADLSCDTPDHCAPRAEVVFTARCVRRPEAEMKVLPPGVAPAPLAVGFAWDVT